jgi:hypothetical protein
MWLYDFFDLLPESLRWILAGLLVIVGLSVLGNLLSVLRCLGSMCEFLYKCLCCPCQYKDYEEVC